MSINYHKLFLFKPNLMSLSIAWSSKHTHLHRRIVLSVAKTFLEDPPLRYFLSSKRNINRRFSISYLNHKHSLPTGSSLLEDSSLPTNHTCQNFPHKFQIQEYVKSAKGSSASVIHTYIYIYDRHFTFSFRTQHVHILVI